MMKEQFHSNTPIPISLIECKQEMKMIKFADDKERKKDKYEEILGRALLFLPSVLIDNKMSESDQLLHLKNRLSDAYEKEVLSLELRETYFMALHQLPHDVESFRKILCNLADDAIARNNVAKLYTIGEV